MSSNPLGEMLTRMITGEEGIEKFNEFSKEYEKKSDGEIFQEIVSTRNEVSKEILRQHIKNLELLGQMEGFVTHDVKQRIDRVKRVLVVEDEESKSTDRSVESSQFFGGSSLLLWFLLVTYFFRGRYRTPYRRSIRRPFFGPIRRPY